MKKKPFTVVLLMMLMALIFAVPVSAASIKLNKTKIKIVAGKTSQLKAVVKGNGSAVKWSTSNSAIATVTSYGKVKGKKAGQAVITAKCGNLSAKCAVTVKASNKTVIAAYRKKIKSLGWPTAVFAVIDINKDGIYEAIVEDIVRTGTHWHPERKGKVLYFSSKGVLKEINYGQSETFCAINSKKQLVFDRTRGKTIYKILSFSIYKGSKEITSFFEGYMSEAERKAVNKKYLSGMRYVKFKKASAANLKKYLSGSGKSTGVSKKWVHNGLYNVD